jgi:pimeloyl-ACP methyl ester carboxylesterase
VRAFCNTGPNAAIRAREGERMRSRPPHSERSAPAARAEPAPRPGARARATLLAAPLALALLAGGCRDRVPAPPPQPAVEQPAIVFVHGLGGNPSDWTEVAEVLGRDHRVVLEVLPGHSHRAMTDARPIEAAAGALAAHVRALGGPVVIVGHSVGGAVAVRAALLAPDRVVGLVLVETALKPQLPPAQRAGIRRAFRDDFAGAVREVYAEFASNGRQADALAREAGAVEPAAFDRWLDDVLGEDLAARAAGLRVPVLVVLSPRSWPRAEPWSATAESLGYTRMAGVTPVRVDSSAHFVMLDRPARLEAAIRAWLPRTRAR